MINPSRVLSTTGTAPKQLYHGIYTGSVVNINDPVNLGRVTLKVPQVLGTATSNWAPPLGYNVFQVPATGTIVHVMFEGGDVNHPVYAFGPGVGQVEPSGDTSGKTDLLTINNMLAQGVPVSLHPGTYYINNTISVPAGASISGPPCGFDTAPSDVDSVFPVVIQLTNAANAHMISVHGDNFYIGNMELDGRRAHQNAGFGNGILVNGHKYGIIEGVSVHDQYFRGILATGVCLGIKILRCSVGANNDTGIYFDTQVTDSLVFSTLMGQNGVHGYFDAGDVNHVIGCDIYTNTQCGIFIANGIAHLVSNNGIDRNGQHGMYIGAPGAMVVGNTFHTNSQNTNGGYDSILVDNSGSPGVYGVSISDNIFWLDPGYTNLPNYHIGYLGTVTTKTHGNQFQSGSYVTGTISAASAAKDPNETG